MSVSAESRSSVSSVLSHALNLFAACAVLFMSMFVIPRFSRVFDDMLGGQPLPPLTDFVLRFRWLWIALGAALFVAVISAAWRHRMRYAPPLISVGVLLFAAAQIGFILFAMFLPLNEPIVRMNP
jgi:type II secretory pathway component PulF